MGKRSRFTMDVGEDMDCVLERVRVAIGAPSKADVVREALALMLTLVEAAEAQQKLWIGKAAPEQRVLVPSLENAARARRVREIG